MTGAMVIVANGTPQQPFIAFFIQATFLLLVLKVAPYKDDLDDWSSFVCSLALTLTTLAGFLLMIKTDGTQEPVLTADVLTTFLIASNALCFVYEMVVIGYVAYQDALAKKAAKMLKLKVTTTNTSVGGGLDNTNYNFTKISPTSSTTKVSPSKTDADNAEIKHTAENQDFEDWGESEGTNEEQFFTN